MLKTYTFEGTLLAALIPRLLAFVLHIFQMLRGLMMRLVIRSILGTADIARRRID